MAVRLPTATRNALANAVAALPDAGSSAGYINIYTGSQPSSANSAPSGTLLATFVLDDPAFGSASSGTVSLEGTPIQTVGLENGTAGWCRIFDGDDATVLDGSVTATGGGGQIQLNTTTVTQDVNLEITAGTITMPSGEA